LGEEPRLSKIKAPSVARRAGLTPGAFYYHWGSQQEFINSLVDRIAGERYKGLEEVVIRLGELADQEKGVQEIIEQACGMALEQIETDPMVLIQMTLWAQHAIDAQSKESLQRLYAEFDQYFLPRYRELLDLFDLEPRPPFTHEMLYQVVAALADGITLRRRLDPDSVPREAFGWVVLGLMPAIIRRKGDQRSLNEVWEGVREELGLANSGAD
jgi:AcrR family transcriptional regulator